MSLDRLKRSLTTIRVEELIKKVFNDELVQAQIIDANTDTLYNLGERADGVSMGEYARFTIAIKRLKGQRYDHVTLQDEGDFYKSIFVEVLPNAIEIKASDYKTEALQEKYGEAILGLNQEKIKELRPMLKEELLELLRKEIKRA